jgi:hypothetical protein
VRSAQNALLLIFKPGLRVEAEVADFPPSLLIVDGCQRRSGLQTVATAMMEAQAPEYCCCAAAYSDTLANRLIGQKPKFRGFFRTVSENKNTRSVVAMPASAGANFGQITGLASRFFSQNEVCGVHHLGVDQLWRRTQ